MRDALLCRMLRRSGIVSGPRHFAAINGPESGVGVGELRDQGSFLERGDFGGLSTGTSRSRIHRSFEPSYGNKQATGLSGERPGIWCGFPTPDDMLQF
jgi:hypothetical protein